MKSHIVEPTAICSSCSLNKKETYWLEIFISHGKKYNKVLPIFNNLIIILQGLLFDINIVSEIKHGIFVLIKKFIINIGTKNG